MLYELDRYSYHKVRPLVTGRSDMNVALNAVIDGTNRGKIWVDNLEEPKTALLWAIGCMYFIIGDPDHPELNQTLDGFLTEVVGPESLATCGGTHFAVTLYDEQWENTLKQIFQHRDLYMEDRYCYIFNPQKYNRDWPMSLSDEYTIKRIDQAVIDNDQADSIKDDILGDFWLSVDRFLDQGIGFCVVKGDQVMSSCFSGYVSGEIHELVVRTYDERYYGQGFATFVTRAYIDYCLANGITPYWSTDEENIGSQILAERCGFDLHKKCKTYIFPF